MSELEKHLILDVKVLKKIETSIRILRQDKEEKLRTLFAERGAVYK